MAAARRRELALDPEHAIALGASAIAAVRTGRYRIDDGREIDWRGLVDVALGAKRSLAPDAPLPEPQAVSHAETRVTVSNETTLGAARRLIEAGLRPLALNFANGVEPGGGFLRGARAQEETLCRSSALIATLDDDAMYAEHRRGARHAASDWVILSPDVPVFRHDDGTALERPWLLSFLTSAAPYAPSVGQPRSAELLGRRMLRVLAVARAFGYDTLVLGAWGCGAFANDPARTAADSRSALEGEFAAAFREVVFAIADWSPQRRFLAPFREVFRDEGLHAP